MPTPHLSPPFPSADCRPDPRPGRGAAAGYQRLRNHLRAGTSHSCSQLHRVTIFLALFHPNVPWLLAARIGASQDARPGTNAMANVPCGLGDVKPEARKLGRADLFRVLHMLSSFLSLRRRGPRRHLTPSRLGSAIGWAVVQWTKTTPDGQDSGVGRLPFRGATSTCAPGGRAGHVGQRAGMDFLRKAHRILRMLLLQVQRYGACFLSPLL